MTEKRAYPPKIEELEEHFRRVRREMIAEYEQRFEAARRAFEMHSKESESTVDANRKVLEDLGLDLKKLEELDKAEDKKLEAFLARVRPKFIEREVDLEQRQRDRVVRTHFYNTLQAIQPACIGADLLASEASLLKDVTGASGPGNPGLWLNNPNDVKDIKVSHNGHWTTSACGAAVGGAHKSHIWHYPYTPDHSGVHWILASLPYHGFYVLNSNDTFWLCKFAEVEVSAYIEIHQYFSHGKQKQTIFSRKRANANEADLVAGAAVWDFDVHLVAGDSATISIGLDLIAVAKGGGSYAEINFDTGVANDIGPPIVGIV